MSQKLSLRFLLYSSLHEYNRCNVLYSGEVRPAPEQMDADVTNVDPAEASRLRGVQQSDLRSRRPRRLHGTVQRRAVQPPHQHVVPYRGHDLAPQRGM